MTSAPTVSYSPARADVGQPARRQGFGHLMLAEWTKIRSVRSTTWTLILFVIITVGFTALIHLGLPSMANWNGPRALPATSGSPPIRSDSSSARLSGIGQLTICVLGALVITTEYSTGVIRASLLAVPKRLPMLAAKIAVFGLLIFVLAEIVAFCSFFVGSAILHSHVAVSLSGTGVLRATLGG